MRKKMGSWFCQSTKSSNPRRLSRSPSTRKSMRYKHSSCHLKCTSMLAMYVIDMARHCTSKSASSAKLRTSSLILRLNTPYPKKSPSNSSWPCWNSSHPLQSQNIRLRTLQEHRLQMSPSRRVIPPSSGAAGSATKSSLTRRSAASATWG